MARSDPTVDYLLELLAPLEGLDACRMFGGWGLRVGGIMFGLVMGETFYLRADQQTQPVFEAAGSVPFTFAMKDRSVTTSYWSVPDEAMDSTAAMLPWARRAVDAALRKAAAKPPRKRPAAKSTKKRATQPASSAVASSASDGDSQQCEPSARSPSASKRRR